jgi:hypothetical protein
MADTCFGYDEGSTMVFSSSYSIHGPVLIVHRRLSTHVVGQKQHVALSETFYRVFQTSGESRPFEQVSSKRQHFVPDRAALIVSSTGWTRTAEQGCIYFEV